MPASVAADFKFGSPPVWEVAMAAMTPAPTLYDAFRIGDMHALFAAEFPKVERQPGPIFLAPYPQFGDQMLQPPAFPLVPNNITRWWFVAPDGNNLVQLQENAIMRNWRRSELPPAPFPPYPGFVKLLSDYTSAVEKVLARSGHKSDDPIVQPTICELVYENMIPLVDQAGRRLRLKKILKVLALNPPVKIANWQAAWFEQIEPKRSDVLEMQVRSIAGVARAMSTAGEPVPIAKLDFSARRAVSSWSEVYDFFEIAHARFRQRFLELTTETAHAMWR